MSSQRFADLVTCVVISLDTRPERWKRTQRLCRLHGITPIRFAAHDKDQGVERFPDVNISTGNRGLWSSFLEVLDTDYQTEWLLVFEDDVIPLPRFRHHVMREIHYADESVFSIRLGWFARFSYWPHLNYKGNLVRNLLALRRSLISIFQRRPKPEVTPWGTHALLLRTGSLLRIWERLTPVDTPLDGAFIRAEGNHPDLFRRARKNLAWQWPDRSDIQSRG